MTTTEDIVIYQGGDFSRIISLNDANNNPLNVTGFSANASMKIDPFSSNGTVYTFQTNLTNGQLIMAMYANVSVTISPGFYSYDIVMWNGTETVRIAEGTAIVDPGISNS